MKSGPSCKAKGRGFSLIELLVVIGIIGIIAALAVPTIVNVSGNAIYEKNRRNAQAIASVAAAAKAAGVVTDLSGTNTIQLLQPPGVSVTNSSGVFSFSVSAMSEEDQTGVASYLSSNAVTGGAVVYTP